MTFTVEIKIGNAAMLSGEDLAEALRRVASELERGVEDGVIRDLNGNTVGHFKLA